MFTPPPREIVTHPEHVIYVVPNNSDILDPELRVAKVDITPFLEGLLS